MKQVNQQINDYVNVFDLGAYGAYSAISIFFYFKGSNFNFIARRLYTNQLLHYYSIGTLEHLREINQQI